MTLGSLNLCVLKKTRRRPESGDIFVFQVSSLRDRYFFGRVVATDTVIGNIVDIGVILIYLYSVASSDKNKIPVLSPGKLLVPPIGTNALAWTRGYFEVVKSGTNLPGDLLQQHCFRDWRGLYFDEYGNRLPGPIDPVGVYGLSGIESIDQSIGAALAGW